MAALATYTFAAWARRGFEPSALGRTTVTVAVADQAPFSRDVDLMSAGDVVTIPAAQVIRSYPPPNTGNAEPNYLPHVELDSPDIPWLFPGPFDGGTRRPWVCLIVVDEASLDEGALRASSVGTQLTVDAAQLPSLADSHLWAHVQLLGTNTVPQDPSRSLARLLCPRRLDNGTRYLAAVVPTTEAGVIAGLGGDPADKRTSTKAAWASPNDGPVTLPVYHWWRFTTGPGGDFEALVRRLQGVPLPGEMGKRTLRLDHPESGLPRPNTADVDLHVALRPPEATLEALEPLTGGSYVDVLKSRLVDAGFDIALLEVDPNTDPPRVGPPVWGQSAAKHRVPAKDLGPNATPPWLGELNLDPRLRVAAGLGAEVVRRNQDHYLEEAWRQVGEVIAANALRRRAEYSLATSMRLHARWIDQLSAGDLVTSTAPVHAKIKVDAGQTIVGRLRNSPLPPSVASVEMRRFSRVRGSFDAKVTWRAEMNPAALASHAAEPEPLVRRVALDSVTSFTPPSQLWGEVRAAEILTTLVPAIDEPDPRVAADKLDQISALRTTLSPPDAAEVAAAWDADAPAVDALLSHLGFLPAARVQEIAAGPAVPVEPIDPPVVRPGRIPVDRLRLIRAARAVEIGDVHPAEPRPVPHLDDVVAGGLLEPRHLNWLTNDDALELRPDLVVDDGGTWRVKAAELDRFNRTGEVAATVDRANFQDLLSGIQPDEAPELREFHLDAAVRSKAQAAFKEIAVGLAERQIGAGHAASRGLVPMDAELSGLRATILRALDPRLTITNAVNSRIGSLLGDQREHFADIMAAPDLSEATYRSLSEISHDWILPGIDAMPADRTTLVAANRQFIAAFLVGLNHELGRELLWHGYPTDQRGTYARQFWTHKLTATAEGRHDLTHPLHRAVGTLIDFLGLDGDPLVLVIKGELVIRYPGLIVTAGHTKRSGSTRVADPPSIVGPDFVGLLEPDVLLVGFAGLTASAVRSAAADPDTAWWFFFAEHFAEPRFGLDDLDEGGVTLGPRDHEDWTGGGREWNAAAWQHAVLDHRSAAPAAVNAYLTAASFTSTLVKGDQAPDTFSWGKDGAQQAWITLQFPFHRGVEAIDLMPPERSP